MSIPLDLGWWLASNGQRRLLTWWSDTGALVLGDVDVIAIVHDEDDLRRRLTADGTLLRGSDAYSCGRKIAFAAHKIPRRQPTASPASWTLSLQTKWSRREFAPPPGPWPTGEEPSHER